MCARLGIHSERVHVPAETSQGELLAIVNDLNFKREIHGILVQSPLPPQISEEKIFAEIDPTKDVDGFHPLNVGKIALGDSTGFRPCTPAGVQELLIRSGVKIDGAHVVVLGRSRIVGRPLSLILSQKGAHANATVTVCHSRSANLAEICRSADILIAAIGSPLFVKADMVREGAIVIDVGANRVEDRGAEKGYRIIGDVDFEGVMPKTSLITPVPGGVGPMTIAMLMHNTVRAAKMRHGIA
jgi:methylenetetrahydrofolate dehydrogenase (NADP+)/methenyltetrahydrofolate cyclohydrolase